MARLRNSCLTFQYSPITIILLAFAGCQNGTGEMPAKVGCSKLPNSFQESGKTWQKSKTLSDRDRADLTQFFRQHPSLAESTVTEGAPVLFQEDNTARRFYWVRPTPSGCEWLMVAMVRGAVRFQTGQGNPIPER